MATAAYVDVPKDLLPLLEELDIPTAGPKRGASSDILISLGVAGGALGASADAVTVLMGRADIAGLARRLWSRGRRDGRERKIVLAVRQDGQRLDVSFEISGPHTDKAAEVFVRSLTAAFSAVLEEDDHDR